MPRPERQPITFSLDGREVQAPENIMLADAAKYGDVEIPVFCYDPKLGQPVGACRMCLVEIEGIPKLQTACSTAVKDGMVVHTQTERVREAQEAVVEFLLINHPLDCPVCDKGGECPLQDISFGWGGGRSRFIEPKRHFRKPLELSPLVAIDRERCILCYRCVRFSQEVAEDYQLVLLERGMHSYVGTFDSSPYVAPFSGNIIELCPVGALTSRPYRFRARPWDVEGAGSLCTLCPAQCNTELTVRDERVERVLGRDHEGVDDGWLCDKGRFAFQAIHVDERLTEPLVRDGGELRPVSWERALDEATAGLLRAGANAAALAGAATTNEEGFLLQRLMREALQSPDIDSRRGAPLEPELHRALATPRLQATVPDLEFAHAVLVLEAEPLDDAPVIDLRIRKGVRHNGVRLVVATSRPSALDVNATQSIRFAPGAAPAFVAALDAALDANRSAGDVDELAAAAGADATAVRELARLLTTAHPDGDAGSAEIVILWGERLSEGPRGADAARALLNVAARLDCSQTDGSGLLELPSNANGRGLREVGVLPTAGPGYAPAPATGRGAAAIAAALAAGELSALYLLHCDPLQALPDAGVWERALESATTIVAHADFLTPGLHEHASVVFPEQSYAEKEGTIVHPDGRLQRLRPAIGHQGDTRSEWRVLAELAARLGLDTGVLTGPQATAQVVAAVPFYAGLTLEEIGGRGVRWQERDAAAALGAVELGPFELASAEFADDAQPPAPDGALRLGTFRSVWAAPEVAASPALKFLRARQRVEISPADADRLGLGHGEQVDVLAASDRGPLTGGADAANGSGGPHGPARLRAEVAVRSAIPQGTVFMEEATPEQAANALARAGEPAYVELRKPAAARAAASVGAAPAGELEEPA